MVGVNDVQLVGVDNQFKFNSGERTTTRCIVVDGFCVVEYGWTTVPRCPSVMPSSVQKFQCFRLNAAIVQVC